MTNPPASIHEAIDLGRDEIPNWVQAILNSKTTEVFNPDAAANAETFLPPRRRDFEDFFEDKYPTDDVGTIVFRILRTFFYDMGVFFQEFRPRASTNDFHRFFLIALQCGLDRAITSHEDRDDLWELGIAQIEDINSNARVAMPGDPERQEEINTARNMFYGIFRTHQGDYDPRPVDADHPFISVWVAIRDKAIAHQQDHTPANLDYFAPILTVVDDGEPYPTPQERAAEARAVAQALIQAQADADAAAQARADADLIADRDRLALLAANKFAADAVAKDLAAKAAAAKDLATRIAATKIATAKTPAAATATAASPDIQMVIDNLNKMGLTPAEQIQQLKDFLSAGPGVATPGPKVAKPTVSFSLPSPATPSSTSSSTAVMPYPDPTSTPRRFSFQFDPDTSSYYYTGLDDGNDNPHMPQGPMSTSNSLFARGLGRVAPPASPHGFPQKIREQVLQPNRGMDAPIRILKQYGIGPESPYTALTLGLSAGVAEGISTNLKSKTSAQYRVRELSPVIIEQDCRVNSFDFNIFGETIPEILGSRFGRTVFHSEGARIAAAQAILQRVVDDPSTSNETKLTVLNELSQIDQPRQLQNQNQMSALEAVKITNRNNSMNSLYTGNGTLIPPPILGTNSAHNISHILKGLYHSLGMDSTEKFTVGDPTCKPLKYFLPALASAITSNRLDEEASYSLLLSITKGDTYYHVRQGKIDDKIPFTEMWITLQKTSSKSASPEGLMRKLEEVFKKYPTDLEGALGRIQTLRAQMFEDYPDEEERKMFTTKLTLKDFTNLIHTYFGTQASGIEASFKNRLAELQLEKDMLAREGRLDLFREPNKINLFKEAICAQLSRTDGISSGPSRLYGDFGTAPSIPASQTSRAKVDIHTAEVMYTPPPPPPPAGSSGQSNQGSDGSNGSNGSNNGSNRSGRNKKNKAGYMKNPNVNNQAFYNGNQNQGYPQQVPAVPQPVVQQPMMAQPQPQHPMSTPRYHQQQQQPGYDPGQAQEAYLSTGTLVTPQFCLDNTPKDTCCLCFSRTHWYYKCPMYPGERPIARQCPTCNGFHPSACKGAAHQQETQGVAHFRHMNTRFPQTGGFGQNNRQNNNRFQPRNGNGGGNGNYRGPPRPPLDPNQPSVREMLTALTTKMAALEGQGQNRNPNQAPKPQAPRGALLANNGIQAAPDNIYMSPTEAQQTQNLN